MPLSRSAITTATKVKAIHLSELRTALTVARESLELSPIDFTDAMAPGLPVKAAHVTELRNGVK